MLCFAPYSIPSDSNCGVTVKLLEEIIRLSPRSDEGIQICVNLVVEKNESEGNTQFGLLHRSKLDNFSFDSTVDWLKNNDFFTKLFYAIRSSSISEAPKKFDFREVRLFNTTEDRNEIVLYEQLTKCKLLKQHALKTSCISSEMKLDIDDYPFCFAQIALPQEAGTYLLRAKAHLPKDAMCKFTFEMPKHGLRCYEVYGAQDVMERIQNVDLPNIANFHPECSPYFKNIIQEREKILIPEFYSIFCYEPKHTNYEFRHSLQSAELDNKLQDLKEYIPKNIANHIGWVPNGGLESPCWFVNRKKDSSFKLHILGASDTYSSPRRMSLFIPRNNGIPLIKKILNGVTHD